MTRFSLTLLCLAAAAGTASAQSGTTAAPGTPTGVISKIDNSASTIQTAGSNLASDGALYKPTAGGTIAGAGTKFKPRATTRRSIGATDPIAAPVPLMKTAGQGQNAGAGFQYKTPATTRRTIGNGSSIAAQERLMKPTGQGQRAGAGFLYKIPATTRRTMGSSSSIAAQVPLMKPTGQGQRAGAGFQYKIPATTRRTIDPTREKASVSYTNVTPIAATPVLVQKPAARLATGNIAMVDERAIKPETTWNPIPTAIDTKGAGSASIGFAMSAVTPNPVRAEATVTITIPTAGATRVELFDRSGRSAVLVADAILEAGSHAFAIHADGLDNGVYYCRVVTDGYVMSRPVTVQR